MAGSGNLTGQDAWVVKVDSLGCEIANCNVGINEFDDEETVLKISPNPASNEIKISIENADLNDYEISIINILGQVQSAENNSSVINISKLKSGVYFISATGKDGKYHFTEKFVKE